MNRRQTVAALGALFLAGAVPNAGRAAGREVIDTRVRQALDELYRAVPGSRELAQRSRAVLVMPRVVKGGFLLGAAYGEGALLPSGPQGPAGPPAGYYSVAAASFGLQAGVQKSAHALFFLTEDSVARFQRNDGWEIGADAEVTFPDAGVMVQTNSTLVNKPVIGIVFGQDGLLLGASLEGAKYSPISR